MAFRNYWGPELRKEQGEIPFSERNIEISPPGSLCKSALNNCSRGRQEEGFQKGQKISFGHSQKNAALHLGNARSACSLAKLSLAVFKSAFVSKITLLRTGKVLQTSCVSPR